MNDAAAGGHPLHRARPKQADIALVVAMAHSAREHIGDGLEAAMRVRRKAGDVGVGIVRVERIEHQERIEILKPRLADDAGELHPRAIRGGDAVHDEVM